MLAGERPAMISQKMQRLAAGIQDGLILDWRRAASALTARAGSSANAMTISRNTGSNSFKSTQAQAFRITVEMTVAITTARRPCGISEMTASATIAEIKSMKAMPGRYIVG